VEFYIITKCNFCIAASSHGKNNPHFLFGKMRFPASFGRVSLVQLQKYFILSQQNCEKAGMQQ
jgi:hypothetical protein